MTDVKERFAGNSDDRSLIALRSYRQIAASTTVLGLHLKKRPDEKKASCKMGPHAPRRVHRGGSGASCAVRGVVTSAGAGQEAERRLHPRG